MCKNFIRMFLGVVLLCTVLVSMAGCGTSQKIQKLRAEKIAPTLQLPEQADYLPEITDARVIKRDTLMVRDMEGHEMIIMRAIRDESTGNMVATEELEAAYVTARFRNIAERNGRIDLEFQVVVPQELQDSKWLLRFHPDMFVLQDSIRLDDVIITGTKYRKSQLRGYQQYEKFLSRIVTDSLRLVDRRNLEIFLARNIPQVYALKTDSTFVSDKTFKGLFGVTEQEALEHYSRVHIRRRNERLKLRRGAMFRKYVKTPIGVEDIKLDTVLRASNGAFVYNYVQVINARPGIRKVDIVLSGEIYEEDRKIYTVPPTENLTFYISSVSAFVDNRERYMTKVISRNATANIESHIDFHRGDDRIDEQLGENAREIGIIKKNLRNLLADETFDMDSISISAMASPDGKVDVNEALTLRRSASTVEYFDRYINQVRDSLRREEGLFITMGDDLSESRMRASGRTVRDIKFKARAGGEDWVALEEYVMRDTLLSEAEKNIFKEMMQIEDADRRDWLLRSQQDWYEYVVNTYYPQLRRVKFRIALLRRGMVKDTIHTSVLDTAYMKGVQAIRDHDYVTAVTLLAPYNDFNTAVAYVATDRNASAFAILEPMPRTPRVNYLLALIYARRGDDQNAVQNYMNACEQDASFVSRGNLDPEISALIRKYGLNKQDDDDDWSGL